MRLLPVLFLLVVVAAFAEERASFSQGPGTSRGGEGAAITVAQKLNGMISIADFAARDQPAGVGNKAWDDAAFRGAINFQRNSRRKVDGEVFGGSLYPFQTIYVPPGDYRVMGNFGAGFEGLAMWCQPHSVTITIDDGEYFYASAQRSDFIYIENFHFIGGKGVLRHTWAGKNVTPYYHVIKNNTFMDYKEVAIQSNADDYPYWHIEGNQFFGHKGSYTKGIALHGLLDGGRIIGNSFLANKIHLQLGSIKSGSTYIEHNDFISFVADYTEADVWIVPNATVGGFGTNSGPGTVLRANKFGNEGIVTSAHVSPRILFAAASGADTATNQPDRTFKSGIDGANYLSGISIVENRFVTASVYDPYGFNPPHNEGVNAPLIANYCQQVDNIYFADSNTFEGGSYSYLVEHRDGSGDGPRKASYSNTSWRIDLARLTSLPFRNGVSSHPIGIINDPNGVSNDPYATMRGTDPMSATLVSIVNKDGWGAPYGSIEKSDIANIDGAADATRIVFKTSDAAVSLSSPQISAHGGNMFWVMGTVKRAETDPAQRITISVEYYDGSTSRPLRRTVLPIPAGGYQAISIPFPCPPDGLYVTVFLSCPEGAGKQVVLGDWKLTRGRSPVP